MSDNLLLIPCEGKSTLGGPRIILGLQGFSFSDGAQLQDANFSPSYNVIFVLNIKNNVVPGQK